jgi:hypothetical protein
VIRYRARKNAVGGEERLERRPGGGRGIAMKQHLARRCLLIAVATKQFIVGPSLP